MSSRKKYPQELRERAVRMFVEVREQHESEWAAMRAVADLLGVGTTETVRKWVRQGEVDGGEREGVTTEESAELKRLRRENAELKRANAILKSASLDSDCQRNTLGRSPVAETLSRPVVEPVGDRVELVLAIAADVGALR